MTSWLTSIYPTLEYRFDSLDGILGFGGTLDYEIKPLASLSKAGRDAYHVTETSRKHRLGNSDNFARLEANITQHQHDKAVK